jgi:hypothetical protein
MPSCEFYTVHDGGLGYYPIILGTSLLGCQFSYSQVAFKSPEKVGFIAVFLQFMAIWTSNIIQQI